MPAAPDQDQAPAMTAPASADATAATFDAATPIDDTVGLGPENGFYPMTRPNAAVPACPAGYQRPHEMRCFAWIRTDLAPMVREDGGIPTGVGYTPTDIQSAYNLDATKGSGQTVVIVDAFGYKTAMKDVLAYRKAAGLPAVSIKVLNEKGQASPLPKQPGKTSSSFGWVYEQSLDLDAVSAACPKCNIVLLQAKDTGNGLFTAIATGLGMSKIVSMSFGGSEFPDPGLPTSGYALVASAGDNGGGLKGGGGPQSPCTFATVICAGGTRLTHAGGGWNSVVWNDEKSNACGGPCGATGSGCSLVIAKPSWQTDKGCKKRSESDISAVASVYTPLAVYNTQVVCSSSAATAHWCGIGGTSLSAPLISGMIGLAGNASSRHGAMEIWQKHSSITDVTKGTDVYTRVTGPCASKVSYICVAGTGYDGPTGWGSPNGTSDL
jgi:subtilase family serine protease